jgi:hypothetical protein
LFKKVYRRFVEGGKCKLFRNLEMLELISVEYAILKKLREKEIYEKADLKV